ncbi:MAG: hypothetical protein ACI9UA_000259 [Pseudoalteromonas tetraodonis]|jgi:hypothetical protein
MKTHFAKLRRLITLSAIMAPLLMFVGFLCLARGWAVWAVIPTGLGIFLAGAFPYEIVSPKDPEGKLGRWIGFIGTFFFSIWIVSLPEILSFLERLTSGEALWDWRLILAVFIWSCHWSYVNHRKAQALKDHEVVAIFDEDASSNRSDP